jgi:glycine/D-amino acid oxidase-like deaminating enzyme
MNHDPDADWSRVIGKFGIEGARQLWNLSDLAIAELTDFAHQDDEAHFATRRLLAHIFSYHDGETEKLREKYELYKSLGGDVSFLEDGSGFIEGFKSVLTVRGEGETNNQMILKLLAHRIRELGGEIAYHKSVERIEAEESGARVITKSGESYSAKRIIIATGDGRGLSPVPLAIKRIRTFVISYKKHGMPELFRESMLCDTDEPFHYIRSFAGNRLWVGGEDVEENEYDAKVDQDKYKTLEKYSREVLKTDGSYERDAEWSGVFFPSERSLPYICDIPDSPISLAVGFGATGILTSFISGFLHAAWLRGDALEYKKLFALSDS